MLPGVQALSHVSLKQRAVESEKSLCSLAKWVYVEARMPQHLSCTCSHLRCQHLHVLHRTAAPLIRMG